jgi:hypothetical protein
MSTYRSCAAATGSAIAHVSGGEEMVLMESVRAVTYARQSDRIYYLSREDEEDNRSFGYLDLATGNSKTVVLDYPEEDLDDSVSSDARWVLFSRSASTFDLMLVENFQ